MTKAEREALKAEFIAGDYRTIKEFAEEKGIAYTGNFRNDVAREHWWKDKQAHAKRVQSAIVAKAEAKRVENALRDATVRQDETLKATSLVREKALNLLETAKSAKEVNAIASALYRINEIERGLLNYDKDGNTDSKGLQPIINIMDCSKDGEDDE